MSSSYVPSPPTEAPVTISRDVLRLLALVDVSTAGRRVLDQLLYLSDPETGTASISQNEMARELGASKPTVNRGFKELRECGLAWALEDGLYQLHPCWPAARSPPPWPCPRSRPQTLRASPSNDGPGSPRSWPTSPLPAERPPARPPRSWPPRRCTPGAAPSSCTCR
ncbi:helix-turn-helix domain-containing protein [Streptomyces sp. Ac-502]|uniref:helix-turn-helix domain-containing protein n=1 Tax=Streptomyces sp. Ac-502 TaxID=3342801 RepID=UPI0038627457